MIETKIKARRRNCEKMGRDSTNEVRAKRASGTSTKLNVAQSAKWISICQQEAVGVAEDWMMMINEWN